MWICLVSIIVMTQVGMGYTHKVDDYSPDLAISHKMNKLKSQSINTCSVQKLPGLSIYLWQFIWDLTLGIIL